VQARLQRAANTGIILFQVIQPEKSHKIVFMPQKHCLRPRETHSQTPYSLEAGSVLEKDLALSNVDVSQLASNCSVAPSYEAGQKQLWRHC